jgi:hypothetical protein
MLDWWTMGRATGTGVVAGLLALLLWPAYAAWPDAVLLPFTLLLLIAALCGLSILAATAIDLVRRGDRGRRVRPLRAFDLVVGLLLAGLSLAELRQLADHWSYQPMFVIPAKAVTQGQNAR